MGWHALGVGMHRMHNRKWLIHPWLVVQIRGYLFLPPVESSLPEGNPAMSMRHHTSSEPTGAQREWRVGSKIRLTNGKPKP